MTEPGPGAGAPAQVLVDGLVVPDAAAMRGLGQRLAAVLRAGDLVVLAGDLGAGKTTLAQGVGAGLGVRGAVTSPTFVIARVHPSETGGPALVHVDAYRLGGLEEVDDLDLDASLAESVTLVEWGTGKVEGLAEDRLEVTITRAAGNGSGERGDAGAGSEPDPRRVGLVGVGQRWAGVRLPAGEPQVSAGTSPRSHAR
jgi:tRNA threonylcarbamoyladenosine biosynthesis protein TsaE